MVGYSAALEDALGDAVTKGGWLETLATVLGSNKTITIKHNPSAASNASAATVWSTGTTRFQASLTGSITYANGSTTSLGTVSSVTTNSAADLNTGAAVIRITSAGGEWVQGTLGLTGAARDYVLSANLDGVSGLGLTSSFHIDAPANLPDSDSSVLTTFTVSNTSGSTVAADFIPPMFGHPFKKGDIATGHYPKFETVGGTNIPYTMFGQTYWSDGSLKFASFLIRVPTTVAGSGSITVNVKSTITAPGSSSRSLADLSSGSTDLQVVVTGLDNLSGTWTSSLNQGVTDNDDILTFGDGPVGKVWRIRQQFMQSGSNHGQLECYWYVSALQDASGNLYGLRYLGRVTQPWYDVDSPAKCGRSFSSFLLKNGASTVRDCWTNTTPRSASYTSGDSLTVTAHGFEDQTLVRASGTTLPSPLVSGTSYFTQSFGTDTLKLQAASNFLGGTAPISLSGSASGMTLTAYPYLTHFGSLWTCGTSAMWDYVQAGGSVSADATVRVVHNAQYWMSTGLVPTYATTTPTTQQSYSYSLGTMGPVQRANGGTGERSDIGVMPTWHVKTLLSQRATDQQVSRVVGLALGHAAIHVLNSSTKTVKPCNSGTYSGMPASSNSFRWDGNTSHTSGFTNPTGSMTFSALQSLTFDHMPAFASYPYMMTGEPQYLDLMLEMANVAVSGGYTGVTTATAQNCGAERNISINGTSYNGVVTFNVQLRAGAWAARDIGWTAALLPDSPPQCAAYKTYFNDLSTANYAAVMDFTNNLATTFWKTSGLLHFTDICNLSPWMNGYYLQAASHVAKMTESSSATAVASHLSKWYDWVRTNHGAWHITAYRSVVRVGSTGAANLITSPSQTAYHTLQPAASWDSGTGLFTIGTQLQGFSVQNGDVMMWENIETTAPGGFSACTPYYVVNKSGTTFQLAATPGGTPIAPTNTAAPGATFTVVANPPSTNCIGGILSASGYLSNIHGALKLAKAAGATVNQALIDDLASRATGIDYSDDPKYYFADTY